MAGGGLVIRTEPTTAWIGGVGEKSVQLDVKRAFPFDLYGRARPGRTASSTAVPGVLLTRKRSQVQTLSRPPGKESERGGSAWRNLATYQPDFDLLGHAFQKRHRLLHERPQLRRLQCLGVRFLAGPQVDHPHEVGIIAGFADERQQAGWIVVEQPARLEQDLHHPLALAWLCGESVEQHVGHACTIPSAAEISPGLPSTSRRGWRARFARGSPACRWR